MHKKTKKVQLQHSTAFHILPACYTLYIPVSSASITVAFRKRLPVIDHRRNAYTACEYGQRGTHGETGRRESRDSVYSRDGNFMSRNFFHLWRFVRCSELATQKGLGGRVEF